MAQTLVVVNLPQSAVIIKHKHFGKIIGELSKGLFTSFYTHNLQGV